MTIEITVLEKLLASGEDNALLRFTLGSAFLRNKKYQQAIEYLNKAIELDPGYSAAWKTYAKALQSNGNLNEAIKAYKKGIIIADKNGDIQASREMSVFLKRLLNK